MEPQPKNIIVNIKLPSERAYNVAWGIALMKGYETLDQWINDWVYEMVEMYVDGRAGFDTGEIDWGFKSREQIEKEEQLHKETEAV